MTDLDTSRKLRLVRGDTIKTKRQKWAWDGRIPLGVVTLFAGRGGEGKSTFALHLLAQLGNGVLPGDLEGEPVTALIISHEDDWSTQMIPRLVANGADTSRVYKLGVDMTVDAETAETVPAFPMDLPLLRDAIEQTGARVLVIDPITSTIGGDLHKVEKVRAALDPVARLAGEYELVVLGILHFNKSAGNVSDKVSGSHAFRDIARSLVLFATDADTDKRIISFDKSSYSAESGSSLEFELQSVSIDTDDGSATEVAQVANLAVSDVSVAEIVNRDSVAHAEADDRNAAQSFLIDYLSGREAGEAPAGDAIKAGRAAGFTDNEIKHARRRSKSPSIASQKSGYGAGWVWALVNEGASEGAEDASSRETASSAPSRHLRPVDEWEDPGCCRHGVTIGGRCRTCGGVAA